MFIWAEVEYKEFITESGKVLIQVEIPESTNYKEILELTNKSIRNVTSVALSNSLAVEDIKCSTNITAFYADEFGKPQTSRPVQPEVLEEIFDDVDR